MNGSRPPMMASLLGWGGVIPFAAAALAWLYGEPIHRIYALQLGTIYAGTIIVFLGAVHWGLAISNEGKRNAWLVWSILPSLAVTLVLFLPAPVRNKQADLAAQNQHVSARYKGNPEDG
jgi:hypothetical protein